MLKDVVEHCKACVKMEDSYLSFKRYVLTSSPSRTLYTLEVAMHADMHAYAGLEISLMRVY